MLRFWLEWYFWNVMLWIDQHIIHDILGEIERFLNPENNDNFIQAIEYHFCQWANNGYLDCGDSVDMWHHMEIPPEFIYIEIESWQGVWSYQERIYVWEDDNL